MLIAISLIISDCRHIFAMRFHGHVYFSVIVSYFYLMLPLIFITPLHIDDGAIDAYFAIIEFLFEIRHHCLYFIYAFDFH